MTGTINRVVGTTFCFIRTADGTDYFAHRMDFVHPEFMAEGNKVEFRPKLAKQQGKNPPATDVVIAA